MMRMALEMLIGMPSQKSINPPYIQPPHKKVQKSTYKNKRIGVQQAQNQQHLVWLMNTKQWSWSLGSQLGKNWLEQVLSSPELEQILQSVMASLKNISQAGCLYSPSGGRWGTMSLLWTTRYIVGIWARMQLANFSLPILGLPKLWTYTGMPGNLWVNSMPLMRDRAAPRLWPVHNIFDILQNLAIALAAASNLFSLSLQSCMKPTCTKQSAQWKQGSISKLKSQIQFWALLLPRHEVTMVQAVGSYPMQHTALVTLFSTQVTLTSLGYCDVVPHDQDYTQFLGQKAMAAQEAYFAEILGSQTVPYAPSEKHEITVRMRARMSSRWAIVG